MFHYVRSDGIIYLCMTDMDAKRRVAFAFLADIRQKFVEKYGDAIYTANAFAMNQSFAPIIKRQMVRRRRALPRRHRGAGPPHTPPQRHRRAQEYFNDPSSDSLSRVRNQLDDVKSVMVENIGVWALGGCAAPPARPNAPVISPQTRFSSEARRLSSSSTRHTSWRNPRPGSRSRAAPCGGTCGGRT